MSFAGNVGLCNYRFMISAFRLLFIFILHVGQKERLLAIISFSDVETGIFD